MLKIFKHLIFIGLAGLLTLGCSKKDEPAVVEEDLLPQEDLEILDESAEEVPDAEMGEANDSDKEVKFATIPKKATPKVPAEPSEPSKPTTAAPVSTSNSSLIKESGNYVVQVAIYKLASAAEKNKNRLIAKGFPAYVAEVQDPTPELSGTYYRLRIGYFSGLSKARAFGENSLEPMGYSFWADLASNDNIAKTPEYESYSETTDEVSESYTPEPAAPEPEPAVSDPAPVEAATTDEGDLEDW